MRRDGDRTDKRNGGAKGGVEKEKDRKESTLLRPTFMDHFPGKDVRSLEVSLLTSTKINHHPITLLLKLIRQCIKLVLPKSDVRNGSMGDSTARPYGEGQNLKSRH